MQRRYPYWHIDLWWNMHYQSVNSTIQDDTSNPQYLQHQWTPALHPLMRWNPGLCWHLQFYGTSFSLYPVWEVFHLKWPPGVLWASSHCKNLRLCFRFVFVPSSDESCTMLWMSMNQKQNGSNNYTIWKSQIMYEANSSLLHNSLLPYCFI